VPIVKRVHHVFRKTMFQENMRGISGKHALVQRLTFSGSQPGKKMFQENMRSISGKYALVQRLSLLVALTRQKCFRKTCSGHFSKHALVQRISFSDSQPAKDVSGKHAW
jgi:hypothetical protein